MLASVTATQPRDGRWNLVDEDGVPITTHVFRSQNAALDHMRGSVGGLPQPDTDPELIEPVILLPEGMDAKLLNRLSEEIAGWQDSEKPAYVLAIRMFTLVKKSLRSW